MTSDLEKLKRRGVSGGGVSMTDGPPSEELTHLQAQNAALQKSLQGTCSLWQKNYNTCTVCID